MLTGHQVQSLLVTVRQALDEDPFCVVIQRVPEEGSSVHIEWTRARVDINLDAVTYFAKVRKKMRNAKFTFNSWEDLVRDLDRTLRSLRIVTADDEEDVPKVDVEKGEG